MVKVAHTNEHVKKVLQMSTTSLLSHMFALLTVSESVTFVLSHVADKSAQ